MDQAPESRVRKMVDTIGQLSLHSFRPTTDSIPDRRCMEQSAEIACVEQMYEWPWRALRASTMPRSHRRRGGVWYTPRRAKGRRRGVGASGQAHQPRRLRADAFGWRRGSRSRASTRPERTTPTPLPSSEVARSGNRAGHLRRYGSIPSSTVRDRFDLGVVPWPPGA